MTTPQPYLKRTPLLLAALLLSAWCGAGYCARALAQPSGSIQSAAEPSVEARIAELEAAKKRLARQARETNGYQESLRQMKIVKLDDLIARLKRGENVPQSEIDHTIRHMGLPLYHAPD